MIQICIGVTLFYAKPKKKKKTIVNSRPYQALNHQEVTAISATPTSTVIFNNGFLKRQLVHSNREDTCFKPFSTSHSNRHQKNTGKAVIHLKVACPRSSAI